MFIHKLAALASIVFFGGVAVPAFADEALEREYATFLADGPLKTALSIKRASFARTLSEIECNYQAEVTATDLDAVAAGMTIEQVRSANRAAGESTIAHDFIARHADFKAKGAIASVRARIVLQVQNACANAAEALITPIE
ncbi:hypothetical protein [Pseudorhodobacter sp. MZDSW-24AT]|uniref:hypothetical protein n=1 Tax=Pseudorhodobacter sp. MZDSW-24AT TaxID=2052957 RepID=UPI000C1E475C|nr:hypothetical protein [Pseudorhodobacter sp. MZDSW-24AT]PJF10796.1 hypothetical protein CUR21_02235 [Pseudorhodobacter sp. MZDSW-24AT]